MRRAPDSQVQASSALAPTFGAGASAPAPSRIDWADFFAKVETTGATFSDRMHELDRKRVVLRGYAVIDPVPDGGLYLIRHPEAKLHPDDEDTLPWDSIGIVWRKGRTIPATPKQPTVEGTLRLGNRQLGTETVILVLEDAIPYAERQAKRNTEGKAAPAP